MKTFRLILLLTAFSMAPQGSAPLYAAPKAKSSSSREARRQQAIVLVKQAAVAYNRRDYKRVISLCNRATDLAPTYARTYTWLGAAHQKRGNKREAISAYRWVVALSPGTADAARAKRGLRELGAS